jgi:6-phosphogluconolactonase
MFSSSMQLLSRSLFIWTVLGCGFLYSAAMFAETLPADGTTLVYFGTYTGARSKGIYVSRFDSATGRLSAPELAATTASPSFLALDPSRRFLYAVGETSLLEGKRVGGVAAFSVNAATGRLTFLNRQSAGGTGPCHVAVDPSGKCLLVANYGDGTIAALPIQADGALAEPGTVIQHKGSSVNRERQAGPHAHSMTIDPANRLVLACDLGLDQVLAYRFDPAKATLVANDPPFTSVKPGLGPRHLAFHPTGRFVFLISEMGSALTVFAYDAKRGALKELQTLSTLPDGFAGKSAGAEVAVHPSGKFVYGSNRGHDSIAVFSFDARRGQLTCVQNQPTQGKIPRHFAFDPTGQWLLAENQESDSVVVFRVDAKTGRLSPMEQRISVGSPVCAVFVPVK